MADISRESALKIVDTTAALRIGCLDEKMATVVSNTGFFILMRLGFEFDEIKEMFKEVLAKEYTSG